MNDQERIERDPVAIQMELMEIENAMNELGPELIEKTETFGEARREFETVKAKMKWLKDRRGNLQSVLRSLR